MKRILAVIPSLTMGGAEKAFTIWVQILIRDLGYEIVVATTQEEADFFSLPEGITRYARRRPLSSTPNIFSHLWRLVERIIEPYLNSRFLCYVIRQVHPDVVIAHLPKSAIPSLLACKKERVTCLVMEHLYQEKLKDPVLNFLRHYLYPWAKGLVVLTPSMKELFKSYNSFITQIANPIVTPSSIPAFEAKKKVILLAGRLTPQKQFMQFVEHLAGFNLKDWRVWIAGEGENKGMLENLINKNHLNNSVYLLGAVSDMSSLYEQASLFVLCSKREGFPLVLVESALYGCARVSFDCPTGPDLIIKDGENGYLVEDQNWQVLFKRINELMESEEKRKYFYKASLKPMEIFDPRKVALLWDNLICKVSL